MFIQYTIFFVDSLQLCQTADSASLHSNVQLCLPLYESMFLFEVTHGDLQKAGLEIEALLASCPEVVELWLLNARSALLYKEPMMICNLFEVKDVPMTKINISFCSPPIT